MSHELGSITETIPLEQYLMFAAEGSLALTPAYQMIELGFSSVFYTYMWIPSAVTKLEGWLGKPFIHTVTSTPYRKFKAILPWISLKCDQKSLVDCLCAELLFSLFYIFDDITDRKMTRYGQQTAYGRYGHEACLQSWNQAIQVHPLGIDLLVEKERIDLWQETLANLEMAQNERVSQSSETDFAEYCKSAALRTNFLRHWWKRAAVSVSDQILKDFIDQIYPLCALSGQLRNDLRNIQAREAELGGISFSDFLEGRATAVTIKVFQQVSTQERSWILSTVWNKATINSLSSLERLRQICIDCGGIQAVEDQLKETIALIEMKVLSSNLHPAQKSLWLAWVYRQFHVGVTARYTDINPLSNDFLHSVRELTSNLTRTTSMTEINCLRASI